MKKRIIKQVVTLLTCWGLAFLIVTGTLVFFNNTKTPKPIHVDSVFIK